LYIGFFSIFFGEAAYRVQNNMMEGYYMFVDNQVVKKIDGEEKYDRFAIASTMLNVSFKGASCSVIESQVLKNCDSCNLKYLCKEIDGVVQDYIEKTTVVTECFSFEN
jgi:hypothetical protein